MVNLKELGHVVRHVVAVSVMALCIVSCVDNDFRLDEVSTEVTVGGDEIIVPLGKMERKTLGDVIGDELEFLKTAADGSYALSFSSYGENSDKWEKIAIDGVSVPAIEGLSPERQSISFSTGELPRSLNVSGISITKEINYPEIGALIHIADINESHTIEMDNLPPVLKGAATLTEAMLALSPVKELVYSYQGHTDFNALLDIPDMVKKLDFVLFGDETSPHGVPVDIKLNLNGLANINGGTTIDLDFIFPNGYYLRDSNGKDLDIHNHLIQTLTLPAGESSVALHLYLHKIDYSGEEYKQEAHQIQIEEHIEYHIDMKTTLQAGQFNMNSPADFTMTASPITYKDVEIVVDHLDVPSLEAPIAYTFDGLPDNVKVERIAFSQAPINLKISGVEWLDAEVYVKLDFPKCFVFDATKNPAALDVTNNCLTATVAQLHDGLTLNISAIDCTGSECSQQNGQLCVDTKITTSIDTHELNGAKVLLSQILPTTSPVEMTTSIAGATFVLDVANTKVEFGSEQVFNFDFSEKIPTISQSVELPEQIVGVDRLTVCKAGTTEPVSISMRLAVPSGKNFPVERVNLNFAVNLGKMLRPTQRMFDEGVITTSSNGDYMLVINEPWSPNTKAFERVVEIEALENLPDVAADGKMHIEQSFPVTGSVTIPNGSNVNLSSENAQIDVDIAIDDIAVSTFTGRIGVNAAPDNLPTIELGDIADLGIDIKALKINPVLRFILKENPVGVPFAANIKLQPYAASGAAMEAIVVPTIVVPASGRSEIVLSTSANRSKYEGQPDVTFVCLDVLRTLLEGELPAKIELDVSVCTDSTVQCTLDLATAAKGFDIEYQYDVNIPLSFDGVLDLAYNTNIDNLNSVFSGVSGYNVEMGDIAIIADFSTTIPLNMVLYAELFDVDGNPTGKEVALNLDNGTIYGYTSDYGDKRTSQLVINLTMGENGALSKLQRVDGMKLKIMLCNTESLVSRLTESQFIEAKFYLRLRGGVTIDVKDFM